ncbi:MAG: methyltransferase domain-containing protein [Anaerolineae bacterium]|nr:methyltransferase domain-containing protein [Anaerolineae bacterium]
MSIDFGKTAQDYKTHRQGFPPAFFDKLAEAGIIGAGKRALDVGTGTGTVGRGMALAGCKVTGLDISNELIEQAQILDDEAGVDVNYVIASAEDTGLPSASFDIFTAGQCWHWFNHQRALDEARRLLVNDGTLVIAYLDWIPLAGNVVELTEKLMQAHNPNWTGANGTGLYAHYLKDIAEAWFRDIETHSFDLNLIYTHEAWRGRVRASAGIGASLPPDQIQAFDRDHADQLARHFPQNPLEVHHRVWWIVARK